MIKTVAHVDAKFDGRDVRFELRRDRETINRLEGQVGSIKSVWDRMQLDAWRMSDVRTVIALAHPLISVPINPFSVSAHIVGLDGKKPGPEFRRVTPEEIDAVLDRRPLATYAGLAIAIVAAAVFGRFADAPAFDENVPGGFPEKQAKLPEGREAAA